MKSWMTVKGLSEEIWVDMVGDEIEPIYYEISQKYTNNDMPNFWDIVLYITNEVDCGELHFYFVINDELLYKRPNPFSTVSLVCEMCAIGIDKFPLLYYTNVALTPNWNPFKEIRDYIENTFLPRSFEKLEQMHNFIYYDVFVLNMLERDVWLKNTLIKTWEIVTKLKKCKAEQEEKEEELAKEAAKWINVEPDISKKQESSLFFWKDLIDKISVKDFKIENHIDFFHEQDCCEQVYIDFENNDLYEEMVRRMWWYIVRFELWTAPWDWFIFKVYNDDWKNYGIFMACRNVQNGYYNHNLLLILKIDGSTFNYNLRKLDCIYDDIF